MWLKRLDGWVFGKLTSRSLWAVCDEIFYWGLYPFPNQENQVVHDVQQYKMKPAENGQPEHKTPLEEISLALAWVWTCLNILRPPEYEYFILFPFMSCCALSVFSSSYSEVSNGSSSLPESAVGGSMLSLTNKASALSLCSDPGVTGSEMQKNGVVHSCS